MTSGPSISGEPRAAGVTPAALRTRVAEALRAQAGDAAAERPTPEQCLAAGEWLLDRALSGDERSRETALDLLAADALVTHAFELAAGRGDDVRRLADDAMDRIAAHAAVPRGAAP